MKRFPFFPELFDDRGRALEILSGLDIHWFSDFRSIDIDHESYGLEVCGICDQEMAKRVAHALRAAFPDWRYGFVRERDLHEGDPGWQVVVCRSPERRQGDGGEPWHPGAGDGAAEDAAVDEDAEAEEGLPPLGARLAVDDDSASDEESDPEPDPLEESLRQESLGDAYRLAGDARGAIEAYQEAMLLAEGAPIPPMHPGLRFRLVLLSGKTAIVAARLGHPDAARAHRHLARLELGQLIGPLGSLGPTHSGGAPQPGPPPRRSLTGLRVGGRGGLDEEGLGRFIDAETGLPNLKGLGNLLQRHLPEAAEPGAWAMLALFDVANGAAIGRRHGPDVLSEVHRAVACSLLRRLHGPGVLARWEESSFAVLLRGTGPNESERARRTVEAARRELTSAPIRTELGAGEHPLYVACGWAEVTLPTSDAPALAAAATQALKRDLAGEGKDGAE